MQILRVVNMFGAIRPREREKTPYGVSRQSVVPTREEAAIVLNSLDALHEKESHRQQQLASVRAILRDLSEGNVRSFLALSEDDFEDHNAYIAESLSSMEIDLLEQQAEKDSIDFQRKNSLFFDEIREEGLNYDHLSDEQIEVMRLKLHERGLTERFEKNARRVDGEVFYQYRLGPDEKYYKSGGVVIGKESKDSLELDKETTEKVLNESDGRDNLAQFADVDAFSMPSVSKRRRSIT